MNDTEPTVPAFPAEPPVRAVTSWAPAQRRRWPSLLAVGLLVLLIVGVPTGLATHYANQYFLFAPGTAPVITASELCKASEGALALPDGTPCVHLVVPTGKAHSVDGKLLMVDVEVSQANALDWAEYQLGLLGKQRQLVPVAAYAGPTPTSELGCQDTQEMVSANQDAAIAALERLHYRVTEVPLGAEVNAVYAGTPAWGAGIKCNDLITAVDGKTVATAFDLTDRLKSIQPGVVVTLTDHPASGGAVRKVKVSLVKPPASVVAQGFGNPSYLGVSMDTRVKPKLPFAVSIDAGGIGGPSAGLAFTLAILDTLSNGKLTGGHIIAATGTISTSGQVGDVGGVQEKTAAVDKAGAQVFFVPKVEYANAESVAGPNLQVVPVTTLQQVLEILQKRYGAHVPGLTG